MSCTRLYVESTERWRFGGGYISGGDKMKKGRNFYRKYKFKVAMWIVFREEFKSGFDQKN